MDIESMSDEELAAHSDRVAAELARRNDARAIPAQIEALSERLARATARREVPVQAAERGAARGVLA